MDLIRFDAVRAWVFDAALPFWSGAALDGAGRGFAEHLALSGRNAHAAFKRVRAQARQIYVFCQFALMGARGDSAEIADEGWRFLIRHARRPDGGWVRRLGPEGEVLDPTCDAYDVAFVLFAHAWRYRLTGETEVLQSALSTVEALNRLLKHPNGLGWLAAEGDTGPRQQNPHMHLMEAAIELALATGHQCFADLAQEVARLFQERVFDGRSGVLREFFAEDWSRLEGTRGDIVEPGHQLEWVWILNRAEPVLGYSLRDEAKAMHAFAERHGRAESGLIVDQLRSDGTVLSNESRLWPQTEAVKANLALTEVDLGDMRPLVGKSVDLLLGRYLANDPPGTWIDQLDAGGLPRVDKIPSTSFYHLLLAFTELMRLEPRLRTLDRLAT